MVDTVRDWAKEHLGYNGERTNDARQMLFHCKKMLEAWCDFPYQTVVEMIEHHKHQLVFVCAREMEDIERLIAHFGARTLLIHKHYINWKIPTNSADTNVLKRSYNYTIYNDSDIDALKDQAAKFLKEIGYEARN